MRELRVINPVFKINEG
jgi:hypothetical protein